MKIILSDKFDASLPGRLARFGEVSDNKELIPEAEVLLIRSKTKCTRELIDGAPRLKLIIRGGVGMDNVDRDYAKSKGIKVYNTPNASSVAVAELAFALMIALPNHLITAHNSTASGQYLKNELKRTELLNKTLGIIGCGRIGLEVAKRARAFGMTVYAYDVVPVRSEYIHGQKSLAELLPLCNYFSLHLPLTPETTGLINRERIALMKPGARIVNTGRGKTVVEADIVAALESGQLAGYGTDVFFAEPPEGSPLLTASHVIMTPHLGASTAENLLRIADEVVLLIEQYSRGELA
ncbi:MAG TPA: NAD(P)-dependent oxidoreductase [bacterium]|nr:NAD(P)-dependent oxidoreductase [bacterium]HPR86837.1 NAD(P)-dependent oxidoreductase [bacterium]